MNSSLKFGLEREIEHKLNKKGQEHTIPQDSHDRSVEAQAEGEGEGEARTAERRTEAAPSLEAPDKGLQPHTWMEISKPWLL